ncbi:uncharacterized protein B0T23DRAFT_381934 [Neurospora hispaniola]|uniref:Uncharacterized protein n=1 Tax=Neurospora hispaniola TaxID=588809 RepID=A0AAJ0I5J4_9PEZI|nr:hypothetical protein B0T23DRAFT_381934 [Neurospora hispaniola]
MNKDWTVIKENRSSRRSLNHRNRYLLLLLLLPEGSSLCPFPMTVSLSLMPLTPLLLIMRLLSSRRAQNVVTSFPVARSILPVGSYDEG